jgi:hypothetical protein
VSEKPPLPQERVLRARCGAMWGGRGPKSQKSSGKGPPKETKPPCQLPNPQPTSSKTDALPLGLLSHTLRR